MKKRVFTLALALAMCLGLAAPAFAAEDAPKPVATVKGDDAVFSDDSDNNNKAFILKSGGKYGAYAWDGKQLAAPAYADAHAYSDGMAAVSKEGSMKVIFDWEWSEEEQKEYNDDGKIWAFEDGKYGYLDETGKLAIPMKYAKAFDFADGRAFVRETLDGPLLMIDKTGKTIASYDNVSLWYYETVQFSEGLAVIPTVKDEDGMGVDTYLVVDTSGKTVYTQEGGYLDFENGYHDGLVAMAEDGSWGTGGPCLERGYNDMTGAGYRDKTGKKVISGDYDYVAPFIDGMAMVSQYDEDWNWKCGFVNTSGKVVVPIEYSYYWKHPGNGYAAVSKTDSEDALGAIVDKNGKFLTGESYKFIGQFKEGLCTVQAKDEGPISVIDTTGKTVFTVNCSSSSDFLGGLILFGDSKANKGYVYDKAGKNVTPMDCEAYNLLSDDYVWLMKNGTYSIFRTADLLGGSTTEPDPVDPPAPAAPQFTDVDEGAYYAAPVKWAVEQNITNGISDTKFSPDQNCTQLHILTFLYRAATEVATPTSEDQIEAIKWAQEKGIIDSSFENNKDCTRATVVSYIWQAFGKPEAGKSSFTDVAEDAAYADAVSWAVENGITNGDGSETVFSPDKVCSRGQIVTFLHRAYVEEARLPVSK